MTSPHEDSDPQPCNEEMKEAADDLKSLRDQEVDPLTPPQKGAVQIIERRLREAAGECEDEKES